MNCTKHVVRFPAGIITPPPSKSYSHRALICAALSAPQGESTVDNIELSQDVVATLSGIEMLGAKWEQTGNALRISAADTTTDYADCGESGSTLRFLLPLAALQTRQIKFACHGRLAERPVDVYDKLFTQQDVQFTRTPDGFAVCGPMRGGVYELPGDVSSQFVSGLLLALPLTKEGGALRLSTPLESGRYVDMTVDVMRRFGMEVARPDDRTFHVRGGQRYRPCDYHVEADYSQAAFFLGAAALGRDVRVAGLEPASIQGDRAILDILRDMGAEIVENDGLLSVKAGRLKAVEVDAREIPDLVPPVAVLCALAEGTSHIINAARLRLKESDRLRAMAQELTKLGAQVRELPDGLEFTGQRRLSGGSVDAHDDHRVAMSMALAAIRCDGPVLLTGGDSVSKSYPDFWRDFEQEVL